MADILQAAKWLGEERKIKRQLWKPTEGWPLYIAANEGDKVVREDIGSRFDFYLYDLLADDWEIAE